MGSLYKFAESMSMLMSNNVLILLTKILALKRNFNNSYGNFYIANNHSNLLFLQFRIVT